MMYHLHIVSYFTAISIPYIPGTHKDAVPDAASHLAVSELLCRHFDQHIAWKQIILCSTNTISDESQVDNSYNNSDTDIHSATPVQAESSKNLSESTTTTNMNGFHPTIPESNPTNTPTPLELCFFPVDNTKGRSDPVIRGLMQSVEVVINESDYVRELKPLSYFRAIDAISGAKQHFLSYQEVG